MRGVSFFSGQIVKSMAIANLQEKIDGISSTISISYADNLARQGRMLDY